MEFSCGVLAAKVHSQKNPNGPAVVEISHTTGKAKSYLEIPGKPNTSIQ